jgi:hypothetical protein
MDSEQTQRFTAAIGAVEHRNIHLTPLAEELLRVAIDAIADDPTQRAGRELAAHPAPHPKDIQNEVIARLPNTLPAVARVLSVMPKFMSGFCPPFRNPPSSAIGGQ